MIFSNLKKMKLGWFVGDFEPNVFKSKEVEISLKRIKKGFKEEPHFHKLSKELNLIVNGSLKINDKILYIDDIFVFEENEISNVTFLQDTTLVVVKIPSIPNDKYIA
tara:strand:- start:1796 stop:2116 length:321 start_codon:yes stop_codon:yes gene_type:complete